MFEGFPYTNFHDLNLDWIIQKVKEAYSPDNPPEDIVLSVNGETGNVTLYTDAVVTFPDVEDNTWNIHRLANATSSGIQFLVGQKAQRIDGQNRYDIYDAGNPPPYPVRSVNGQTGNVTITIPVTSVNGLTGAVTLYRQANIAFPNVDETQWNMYRGTGPNGVISGIQFKTGDCAERIDGSSRYEMYDAGNPPPYPVSSVGTLTGAVAILDTTIVTDQGQQKLKITFPVTSVDGQTGAITTWANHGWETLTLPTGSEIDEWGLEREITSGKMGISMEYDEINEEFAGYITFTPEGSTTVQKLKILTPADIPSSAGVISINGQTGAVTLTGSNIHTSSTDTRSVATAIGSIESDVVMLDAEVDTKLDEDDTAFIESGSTATRNYTAGQYILISGTLNKALVNISAGDTFSASNVGAVTIGSQLTDIYSSIATVNNHIVPQATNSDWKTYPGAPGRYVYYYEASAITTYDIPYQFCFVITEWKGSTRAIATAYRWAKNTDARKALPAMWVNQMQDSWQGWTNITGTIDWSSKVGITSSTNKCTISQLGLFKSGNVVSLNFLVTTTATVAQGGDFGLVMTPTTADFNILLPKQRSIMQPNLATIQNCNILPSGTINLYPSASIPSGTNFWVYSTYVTA